MLVKTSKRCFASGHLYEPGEVFDFEGDKLPSYMKPASPEEAMAASELDTTSDHDRTLDELIQRAASQLDPQEDGHWTQDGLPRLEALIALVGRDITRADVAAAVPGFQRER